ncbi:MAG: dihydrodipicolinate synthase family protein [Bifidobacteriaceae bacterium]|jgi:4-hydroxy-tetrahydrodipicolinate synthase|nr:dihydrodipicolinate synthase family protein [Bifidobacteriaceae bacterium]MCI1978484.1 dihydrodipicolinate synthase family protein [Bifidobacteriaceae bacterium]
MFKGVFCPSITITKDDGSIDYELWGRHLDHLATAGINGVLLFGSIGEFYAFPLETKEKAVDFAVKRVAGRMKVFAGVGSTVLSDAVAFTQYAEKAGVDAVVAVSPYYFGPTDDGAKHYFGAIAEATTLPVLLYNFPARTGTDLNPELVADLAREHSNIAGIKDTVDTISHTRKVIVAARKVNPDFAVFSGFDEYYFVNRISGGNGIITGLTNVEPETFVALHKAYESGDFAAATTAAQRISHLMKIYDVADLFVSAIKGGVKLKGLPISTKIQEPAVQLTDEQLHTIESILEANS